MSEVNKLEHLKTLHGFERTKYLRENPELVVEEIENAMTQIEFLPKENQECVECHLLLDRINELSKLLHDCQNDNESIRNAYKGEL